MAEGDEFIPDGERRRCLVDARKIVEGVLVGVGVGGENSVEQNVDIAAGPPDARGSESEQRAISKNCFVNLGVTLGSVALAQEKVTVIPCDLCGERINGAGVGVLLTSLVDLAGAFVGRGEVHMKNRGVRVRLDGVLVCRERLDGIVVFERELEKTAEGVPCVRVAGLQMHAVFDGGEIIFVDAVIGEPEPGRVINHDGGDDKSDCWKRSSNGPGLGG